MGRPPLDLCWEGGEASGADVQDAETDGEDASVTRKVDPGEDGSQLGAESQQGWDLEREWLHPLAEPPDEPGPWTGIKGC